jgi:hypothetical protein
MIALIWDSFISVLPSTLIQKKISTKKNILMKDSFVLMQLTSEVDVTNLFVEHIILRNKLKIT